MSILNLPWGETLEVPDDWDAEQVHGAYKNILAQRVRDNKPDITMTEFPFEAEYGTPIGAAPGEALHYFDAPFKLVRDLVATGYSFLTKAMTLPEGEEPTPEMQEEERIMSSFGLPDARAMTKGEVELQGQAMGWAADYIAGEAAFKYGPQLAARGADKIADILRGPAQHIDNATASLARARQSAEAALEIEVAEQSVKDVLKEKPELEKLVRQTELEATQRPYNPLDPKVSHEKALDEIEKIHGKQHEPRPRPGEGIEKAEEVVHEPFIYEVGEPSPYLRRGEKVVKPKTKPVVEKPKGIYEAGEPSPYVSTRGQRVVEPELHYLGGEEEFVAHVAEENARFVYRAGEPSEFISTRGQRVVEPVEEATEELVKRTPEEIEATKRELIDSLPEMQGRVDYNGELLQPGQRVVRFTGRQRGERIGSTIGEWEIIGPDPHNWQGVIIKKVGGRKVRKVDAQDLLPVEDDLAKSLLPESHQQMEFFSGPGPPSHMLEELIQSTVAGIQRVAGTLGRVWSGLKKTFPSPDFVAKHVYKDKVAHDVIKFAGKQDRAYVRFVVKQFNELKDKTRGILDKSDARIRVGRWLDNPDDIADPIERARIIGMSKEEYRVGQWMKDKFENLINEWGTRRLLDHEGNVIGDFEKVKKMAREGATPDEIAALNTAEQEVLDVFSRKIQDYLPHMLDKKELLSHIDGIISGLFRKAGETTDEMVKIKLNRRIKSLQGLRERVEGGMIPLYQELPATLRMKYFEPRKANLPYSFDALEAYRAYLSGISKKIFDEPVTRRFLASQMDMAPEAREYMAWFTKRYLGQTGGDNERLFQAIRNAEWVRTLGLNPRSALGNMTQKINTVAEMGRHSIPGYWRALRMRWNPKDMRLWDLSGIEAEIPQVLMGPLQESKWLDRMERIRRATGFFFTQVERGNRKHAFFSALEKYKHLPEAEAIEKAIDVVHKTQFQYGRVGMPKVLGEGVGSVALQFWSFPIKQAELMYKWFTGGPKGILKAASFLAMAEGGNHLLREHLNSDLSNYLGFGFTWGEFYKMAASMTKGEWEAAGRHYNLMVSRGTGILPQGPGPGLSAMMDAVRVMNSNKTWKWWANNHLNPVMYNRVMQAMEAVEQESGGKYPVFERETGERMYDLTATETAMRAVGPRPAREVDMSQEHYSRGLARGEQVAFTRALADALVRGDMKAYNNILKRVPDEALPLVAIPSKESLEAAMLRRNLPRNIRDFLSTGKFYLYHEAVK